MKHSNLYNLRNNGDPIVSIDISMGPGMKLGAFEGLHLPHSSPPNPYAEAMRVTLHNVLGHFTHPLSPLLDQGAAAVSAVQASPQRGTGKTRPKLAR